MSSSNKILVLVFFALILIVVGEFGYYFYYQPLIKAKQNQNYIPAQINNLQPQVDSLSNEVKKLQGKLDRYRALALLMEGGNFKFALDSGVLTSSTLTQEYQGIISNLDRNPGRYGLKDYLFKMTVHAKQDWSFIYNEHDVSVIKVVQLVNNKEIPIKLEDLQIGDEVTILATFDNFKDWLNNAIKIKITKKK